MQDRHEVINGLHWGPDGWLYHAVLSDVSIGVDSASGQARRGSALANSAHWIGFSLEVGPDGAVWVLD